MKVKHLLSAILVMGAAVLPGASSVRAQEAYFAVTTYADGVDAKPGDGICATTGGECTLRAAIQETNLGRPGWIQRIVLEPGEYLLTIPGAGEEAGAAGDLDVTGPVQIEGPLAQPDAGPFAFLDGGGLDRVLHVHSEAIVYLRGIVIRNGQGVDLDGGGILNEGELYMEVSQVVGNKTGSFGNGGGILNRRWLTLSGVTVSGNSSTLGGGIFNAGGLVVQNTTVSQNTVDGEGGGIFNYKDGTIRGTQVTINDNHAVGSYGGGGVYSQGYFDVGESTIAGNSAGWSGGGVANIGMMFLTNTTVGQNNSQGPGGGIYNGGTATVVGGSVTDNTSSSGGGIANYEPGVMTLEGVRIANNTTAGFGGGVENGSVMSLTNVKVEVNNAVYGGGIANTGVGYDATASLKISGSTVQSNIASGYGGGLINVYGIAEVRQSLVVDNTALLGGGFTSYFGSSALYETTISSNHTLATDDVNAGGGVYAVGDGKVSLDRCTIAENTAEYGAGVFTDAGSVVLTQSTVYNNIASISGGGLFNFLAGTAAKGSSGPSSSPIVKINPSLNAHVEGPRALNVSLTILKSSTVSGNEAGTSGGGIYNTSVTEIADSTIAFNKSADSDAIYNAPSAGIIIGNSILRSATGAVPTCAGGGFQSRGFNLEDRQTCSLSGKGDIVDTDPLLGQLADNGGPTLTHALLPGSPAIDAGSNILCGAIDGGRPTDQRGQARPMDGNNDGGVVCDIGAFEVQGATRSFGDVAEGHWAYGYIEWLYEDGYIAGCSANPRLYCPDVGMNRAEASVFVERGVHGAGYEPAEPSSSFFTDVPLGLWFTKWVQQLWVDGFTAGCSADEFGNRQFCPYWPHTRAEATVFFTRMMKGPTYEPPAPTRQVFADVPIGADAPWYSGWVNAAYEAGIIGTCEDIQFREAGMFHPNANLRRAESACMMVNALGLNPK